MKKSILLTLVSIILLWGNNLLFAAGWWDASSALFGNKSLNQNVTVLNGGQKVTMSCVGSTCNWTTSDGKTIQTTQIDSTKKEYKINWVTTTCEQWKCVWWDSKYAEAIEWGSKAIQIFTSEKIPGAECTCAIEWWAMAADGMWPPTPGNKWDTCVWAPVAERKYVCTVIPGLGNFQKMFWSIIKYLINIVLLLGVLAIVGLGIAWSFAGWDDVKAKWSLKKWWVNIIVGLIILFMFQYILKFLAPWIYQ